MQISDRHLNRNIVALAVPAAGENLLHMTIFITDAVFMSWVGTGQLAAVDMSAMIAGILMMLGMAVSTAATSLVARSVGAGRPSEAGLSGGQSMLLGFFISILLATPVLLFAPQLLWLMGLESEVAAYGVTYLRTVMWAAPLRQIISTGCSILRGAGDTTTPMFVTLLMNVVNIVLGIFLIFGIWIFPRLEVFGAALAANGAAVMGAGMIVVLMAHGDFRVRIRFTDIFQFHWPMLCLILRVGIPAALEMFVMRVNFLLYYRIIASLGTDALAINAVAMRIESLSFMPGMGIAMATMTLVGQSLGAGDVALAEKSLKRCAKIAVYLMTFLGLLCVAGARPMASFFLPEARFVDLCVICIQVAAFEQPLLGFVMVYMGGLRGAGDTRSAMLVTFVGSTLVRLPAVFLLARTFGLGVVGAWIGACVDWGLRALMAYWVVRNGRWKTLKLEISPRQSAGEKPPA